MSAEHEFGLVGGNTAKQPSEQIGTCNDTPLRCPDQHQVMLDNILTAIAVEIMSNGLQGLFPILAG